MNRAAATEKAANVVALTLDAAVIGAGAAGVYQLHLLRNQGLTFAMH